MESITLSEIQMKNLIRKLGPLLEDTKKSKIAEVHYVTSIIIFPFIVRRFFRLNVLWKMLLKMIDSSLDKVQAINGVDVIDKRLVS
jgi:hypothetical protein